MPRKGLFNDYHSIFLYLFKAFDAGVIVSTAFIAAVLLPEFGNSLTFIFILVLISLHIYFFFSRRLNLYNSWRLRPLLQEHLVLLHVTVIQSFCLVALAMALHHFDEPRSSTMSQSLLLTWLSIWFAMQTAILLLGRVIGRQILRISRRKRLNQRQILLVGETESALRISDTVDLHPEYGLNIIGIVGNECSGISPKSSLPHLGSVKGIRAICERQNVDQVWLTVPLSDTRTVSYVLAELEFNTISVRQLLDFSYLSTGANSLTRLRDMPLLDIDVSPMDGSTSRFIKSIEDRILAAAILLVLSPLLLMIAAGIKLSSKGPVFYRQKRMGWNNIEFDMLKFRTMPPGSDRVSDSQSWSSREKARSSWFADFLRRSSLDELPQFFNVLKGEMSIVGPRPERPEFVHEFKERIPRYMKKHMMKAGITGWAQVNGLRGDTDLNKRIEYDLFYIKNWSPLFDLIIAFQTLYRGFFNRNAY